MKQYIQLTNEEIKRSFKVYVIAVLVMAAIELLSVVVNVKLHERRIEDYLKSNTATLYEAFNDIGKITFVDAASLFSYVTLIGMALVLIYTVQIWYRDWIGETKYIYRLLMLPGNRASIFFSKLTTVFLIIMSFLGIQWCLIQLGNLLFQGVVREDYIDKDILRTVGSTLGELFSLNLTNLFVILALSLFIVSFMFLLVLIERSYRKWSGFIRVGVEIFIMVICSVSSIYFLEQTKLLLNSEKAYVLMGLFVIYFVYVIWRSLRLLKWKIAV
ncbi:hypothetical protein [Exiguobacterium acetylicum]|uniref:hypothetical protein n=1 Tax=Exiguobacterium acetylicum TaxID=41170 RepID=UPI0011ED2B0C|nr:hypothetical protein [Exiguobacterium acetylicum]